jgi:two-component system, chemotaxis family, sensor kinase CheA
MSTEVIISGKQKVQLEIESLAKLLIAGDLTENSSSLLEKMTTQVKAVYDQAKSAGFDQLATFALDLARKLESAKGVDARRRTKEKLLVPWGGALDPAPVLREFLQSKEAFGRSGQTLEAELQAAVTGLQEAATRLDLESGQISPPEPGPSNSLAQDPELISDFLLESGEHLSTIEAQLLTLERDPTSSEAIHSVFRAFHTIKGLAGFLEFGVIQEVAHETETLLDKARNGDLSITPGVVDVVLESADYLKTWIAHIKSQSAGGNGPAPARNPALNKRIRQFTDSTVPHAPDPATPELVKLSEVIAKSDVESATCGADSQPAAWDEPAVLSVAKTPRGLVGTHGLSEVGEKSALEAPPQQHDAGTRSVVPSSTEVRAVKVDTGKLDYLVEMAGEMVIAQSLISHDPDIAKLKSTRLIRNMSQAMRITSEVQKTAMAMRMLPIGNLFQRMVRLVRDLSRKAGKQVSLEISGEETELDRTIVEDLADPLMHMVRNSVDHGLEQVEERIACGKLATGLVSLSASHQGGNILIEVSDDGRGLNRDKILAKAREKGLIENGEHLTDNDVFQLIFAPGFSTADKVTDISGRGVGMDVVRKNIEKMRGRIDIQSTPGKGTTFFLRLPLTLAIIDGLVVGIGEERYIVPMFAVQETLRATQDMILVLPNGSEMALIRGKVIPIMRLSRYFKVSPRSEDISKSLMIICEGQARRFCVIVDELIGKQEVVIKSLGKTFKRVAGIAGGAILGDGRVGLILDMDGIARAAGNA